ncbi:MAG: prenyltransferase/squalene oxidase repeat-containing protein [Pirellulaceae bacterium]
MSAHVVVRLLTMIEFSRLKSAYETAKADLLAERTPDGHWVGELSTSALSTATAVSAFAITQKNGGTRFDELISGGIAWLVAHQNDDGGFGDTDKSYSNIATTMLVVAAIHLAGHAEQHKELLERAEKYIDSKGRLKGLRERYGVDKTFVVPIMTNLALAGLVEWKEVSSLPFELACVPQSWYRFMRMPVVSYAIPALVAIGQCRYFHQKPWNPVSRLVRSLSISRSLKVLRQMQPESGGYLEAVPLTSFVVMSLASTGRQEHAVTREGIKFLVDSVRPDGSWPIDTNLATWVTTLSINALASGGEDVAALLGPQCLDWLLSCQHLTRHPFTGADPGGWGWSDLSGAVPDADDTPGALLALTSWNSSVACTTSDQERIHDAIDLGMKWLINLQNSDRGWPTFCRGWSGLPFDRSGADLTAHVIRAFLACSKLQDATSVEVERARRLGCDYLLTRQKPDGSWLPLWFGNQEHDLEDNPVYGTSKALLVFRDAELSDARCVRGLTWLRQNQNPDGGWGSGVWRKGGVPSTQYSVLSTQYGGQSAECRVQCAEYGVPGSSPSPQPTAPSPVPPPTSSVEETALAVEALLAAASEPEFQPAIEKGLTWLVERVEWGEHRNAAPIGFYFAKLWYYEKLYPLAFTVSALGRAVRTLAHD